MDSPGFNANFCTYDLMNNAELGILDVVVIDKREVGLKSTKMERRVCYGFKVLAKRRCKRSRDLNRCTFPNYKVSQYVVSFVFISF